MPKCGSRGQGEGVGSRLGTLRQWPRRLPGRSSQSTVGTERTLRAGEPERRARPAGHGAPARARKRSVRLPVQMARFEGLEKRVEKNPRGAEECRRQGEKPQSRRQNFARLERECSLRAGRKWEARPGRLGQGSERHKERTGGGAGGGKFREPEKGEEEEVQRTRRTLDTQGCGEGSRVERAGSPGGAQRHPLSHPLSPPGPNPLTMMEKTKATMLMGYAGQKHETMASHR